MFSSTAANLGSGENSFLEILIHDCSTGATERVSQAAFGIEYASNPGECDIKSATSSAGSSVQANGTITCNLGNLSSLIDGSAGTTWIPSPATSF